MPDQAKAVSRPGVAILRFSVRGLIVLVLLIGCWMGWLVRSARIQRDAVAAIKDAGGTVSYEWEWSDGMATAGENLGRQSGSRISLELTISVTSPRLSWPAHRRQPMQ